MIVSLDVKSCDFARRRIRYVSITVALRIWNISCILYLTILVIRTFDLGLMDWYKCGSNRGSFTLNVPYSTDDYILARSKKKLLNTYLPNDIMKACYIFNNYDENNCEKVEFLTQCMLDEAAFTFVCRACCVVNDTVVMRRNITRKTNVKAF